MPNYLKELSDYSTRELVSELAKREGVDKMTVAPHAEINIKIDEDWYGDKEDYVETGSAIILVVGD
jgi:hypothetical protein